MRSFAAGLAVAVGFMLCPQAQAQLRALENPSFELNDPAGAGAPNFEIITNGSVVGWDSTTGEVELWDSNFNGVPAYAGNVFAEMNANVNGTLFQNICLINGEPIGWTFAHRARAGGAATQTAIFQVANSSGTIIQSLATQNSTTANQVWNVNSGSTTYTGPSGLQRVQFTTSNPGSYGNFLDGIQMTLRPFVQLSIASATGVESIGTANVPALRITGFVASSFTVNVNITGGTATLGSDYTTPNGSNSFTVTIPAGSYNNTAVSVGVNITDDTDIESSETINFALAAGSNYTIGHTATCGSAAQTSASYTITDNDARVTLRKQWTNAAIGDDANVTLTRFGSTIDTLASEANVASELDVDASPTPVVIGETLALAETLPPTNVGSYTASVACTGTADSNLGNGLTIGAGETAIICTYTNNRISQSLRLAKTWGANSGANHSISVTTTGGINNPTLASTAPTNTNGTNVTVFSGEVITLPAETFGGGAAASWYNSTVACTGGSPLPSGAVGRSLTITASTTATVCTYVNTRRTATLTLRKSWVNAITNNAVTVATTGLTTNSSFSSVANSANETDSGSAFTVLAGDTGTIAENFTNGLASNYVASLACTGNSNALAGSNLTIAGTDTAIVCTFTNARTTQINVTKTSSIIADGVNSSNFKAIPGATIRYCITVTNAGTATASNIVIADPVPSDLSFVAGSMRSGASCAAAATVEDDNNSGTDETDPIGMNIVGTTINASATTLAPAASFALQFDALVR